MKIDLVSFLSVVQAAGFRCQKAIGETQPKCSRCTSPSRSVLPGICTGASCMGHHRRLIFANGSSALGL